MTYSFTCATESDKDAIFEIYETVMRPFIEKIWGWNDIWQKNDFDKYYELSSITLIKAQKEIVGYAQTQEFEDKILIRMLAILPEHQRKGNGTKIINDVLRESQEKHKKVFLEVFKINKKAIELYRQAGFRIAGESPNSYALEWVD